MNDVNVYKANLLCEITDDNGASAVQKIEMEVPEKGKKQHVIPCESCGREVTIEAVSREMIQERRKGAAILSGLLILYILLIFFTNAFGSDDMTQIILYAIAVMGLVACIGIVIQIFGPGSKLGLKIILRENKKKKTPDHRFVSEREIKKIQIE